MPNTKKEFYTLVTGSASGFGKALAIECAKRNMNIILIDLPDRELAVTSEEIREKFTVKVHSLELNLATRESPEYIQKWCDGQGYSINMLINNTSLAVNKAFIDSSPEQNDELVQHNIRAMILLSQYFMPRMKSLPGAYILNVAGLSAFYPTEFNSVYSASKAFVLNFTKAVNKELTGTSLHFATVCPEDSCKELSKLESAAKYAITQLLKGKTVIVKGTWNRVQLYFRRLVY
jgi:uncharacterized protein